MAATVLRRTVLALLLVLAVAAVWTAVVLGAVRNDLLAARAELESASSASDVDGVESALGLAQARLQRSSDRMAQPGPALVARLPVVGRSVRAVELTSSAGLAVTSAAREVVLAARDSSLVQAGGVDLDALARLAEVLDRAAKQTREPVAALLDRSDRLVPGPVAGPLTEAQDRLGPAPDAFGRGAAALDALAGVLGAERPRRLLVVLENNAELRATGGLISVFAEATAEQGRLSLSGFRDVVDVAAEPSEAVPVPAPADYRALWGPFLADTTLWRNVNMAPDVPTSLSVLSEVAAATLAQQPDVVVRLDVPALAAVLTATGPVALPDGTELRGEDTVDVLLSRSYVDAPDTVEGQAQRRAVLRSVADAALDRLLGGGSDAASVSELGPALARAALGRHLGLWSADEQEQGLLERAGLAGRVAADGGDLSTTAVHNLGGGPDGNKLDYYAERSVRVRAVVGPAAADVVQEVSLRNGAPSEGLPTYVAGTTTPGTTGNLVSFAVPADAQDVVLRRAGLPLDSPPRPMDDHAVVTDVISLAPGASVTWEVSYRLPLEGSYRLSLFPQPLHADAQLDVVIEPADGQVLRAPPGSALTADGPALVLDGPFAATEHLEVAVERPGRVQRLLDAVRRFWQEPVQLP